MTEGQISAAVAAKLVMVTDRHLRRLVAEGWIRKTDDGQYTLVGVVQGDINCLKDEQRNLSETGAMPPCSQSEAGASHECDTEPLISTAVHCSVASAAVQA